VPPLSEILNTPLAKPNRTPHHMLTLVKNVHHITIIRCKTIYKLAYKVQIKSEITSGSTTTTPLSTNSWSQDGFRPAHVTQTANHN